MPDPVNLRLYKVAKSKTALRRLPVGSVVLSHRGNYRGWAWQKTRGERWWAQDSNTMPTDGMVAFLGPLTVIYRAGDEFRG